MGEENKEPVYEKPTSQLDLEARLDPDWRPHTALSGTSEHSPLDRGGFVGVDPVYQNAANEAQRPMNAEDGPEAELEKRAGVTEWKGDEALPEVDPAEDPLVLNEKKALTGTFAATPTGKQDAEKSDGDGGSTSTSTGDSKDSGTPTGGGQTPPPTPAEPKTTQPTAKKTAEKK